MTRHVDVLVIGAGPAGLAAACAAAQAGAKDVWVLERDTGTGGILNQCIHNGFGLHYFKEELTGPEYAARFSAQAKSCGVHIMRDTMVLSLSPASASESASHVTALSPSEGLCTFSAGAVVLAMGCRERTRGAIGIPGDRPAGVFTAGAAQRYVNIEGYMVGRQVLILGSGDIGLIMARRMTLEGAAVAACVELMPYSNGLNRNIVQCLHDYDIPLYLSHTLVRINGRRRVESAVIAEVDAQKRPIPGTERTIPCDTILLSVGLIPESELTHEAGIEIDPRTNGPVVNERMQTSLPGVFACGNVVHVHDLVDFVTEESLRAGQYAALHALSGDCASTDIHLVQNGDGVTYTVPQKLSPPPHQESVKLFFRVRTPMPSGQIVVRQGDHILHTQRRTHMTPGEMEHILLTPAMLNVLDATGNMPVVVDVKPVSGSKEADALCKK